MEYAGVEVLLCRQMPYTRHKRLPQRPISSPSGKHFGDCCVVDGRFTLGVVWDGQALPRHPGVEHPHDEVADTLRAECALRPPLGHREVWQDKCGELVLRELDRNRRRCRLLCRGAHYAMAL